MGRRRQDLTLDPLLPDHTPVLTPTGKTMILHVDHVYDENYVTVWEEVKGFWAEDATIKAALFEAIYKVKLRVVRR